MVTTVDSGEYHLDVLSKLKHGTFYTVSGPARAYLLPLVTMHLRDTVFLSPLLRPSLPL